MDERTAAIEEAILKTVLYGDIFHFAMTPREVHHFLIADSPCSLVEVEHALAHSATLQRQLSQNDGYAALATRADLIPLRQTREPIAALLWPQALTYGRWLACLPFVRMVAITGALAMHNPAHAHDDLDYVLVTAAGRVWLARAFSIVLVRLARLRGVTLCPNYVLAETALTQSRHDLYIAHEIVQMVPLYGIALYEQMRVANHWAGDHLPNAHGQHRPQSEFVPSRLQTLFKRCIEGLLGGRLGDAIEAWEYRRKLARFAPDLKRANHAAQLDQEHVKGHFNHHGHPVLMQYEERLRRYGLLDDASMRLAGD